MKTGIEYLTSDTKRRLDLIGGSIIAASILPAAAVIGTVAAVDTKDFNPFFEQERLGKGGEPFKALKFRTIAKSAMSERTYGTFDPRASRIGQLLRQSGLDELPQIRNVIDGSMSLVGARPMVAPDIEFMADAAPHLFDEWHGYYQATRPGLAGPSQAYRHHFRNGISREIYRQSAELDLRYFDTASLTADMKILARAPIDMLLANMEVVENVDMAATEERTAA